MTYLEKALKDGYAEIVDEGKKQKIIYKAVDHSERYSDPEEQVRAEFWAELIYHYQYEPNKIGIEITVPDRTPSDRADIVVFRDSDRKRPYTVVECKRDGVSDAEFNQAVEQAYGNGTWAKFRANYVMVVAGATRRVLDCTDKYGALERDKNIVADLPIKYGKPEEYKYFKATKSDIQPVNKESLITAIQKCHQTLWGGGRLSPPAAFGELCKVLFVKVRDEKKPRKKGQPYEFQIKTHEESRRLAERIRGLYEDVQQKEPEVFTEFHNKMKQRRELRNDFFHSAKLLTLSVAHRDCVEAFCDLLDYGELLFQTQWKKELSAERTLDSLEILLRLERKCCANPALTNKVNEIFKNCPRYKRRDKGTVPKKGFQITEYPDDLHLILSILDGGQELRDKLTTLLP